MSGLHHYGQAFSSLIFFFNDTATTEIYTLSLHDALPIWIFYRYALDLRRRRRHALQILFHQDRKSTRLNSSHLYISYAVFCLKKNKRSLKRSGPTRAGIMAKNATPRCEPRNSSRTLLFFFLNKRPTPKSSPLPPHDALPI